ncbi:dehydrogenase/reductase SDR family protein 7-like isoform X2 [Macrosteles quadrilineatus]|nr:dehydrogenase/reductase SDR family protein 7-like isoform X2 [Macrosteles quadrilineatus]XP_054257714.1 dehydrogenase/reductase SDR family protein 7-like isoform X2 [Macrosteles quadrilineatus]XP_054257715.1 dehydrogenase/reductase SDR family protein 7-like isoform X2 [Macrosteles quadrilineatus]
MGDLGGWPLLWWLFGSMCIPFTIPWLIFKLYRHHRLKAQLRGKVVLITGASSGLGEALAHVFYQAGCRVILAARREAQLERVKKELLSSRLDKDIVTHPPVVMVLDLIKIDEIPSCLEKVLKIVGHVDILINNAGISYRGEVLTTNIKVDTEMMMINYIAQVALIKALLPSMVLRKSGQIVAISSVQGRIAIPYRSAYTASKHALQAFCDTLRAEVAHHNVSVTVVSPGYISTNLSLNALTGTGEKYGVVDETTAKGYEPLDVAKRILVATMKRQSELIVSDSTPKIAMFLRTLLPSVYFYLMKNRALRLRQQALLRAK